MSEHKKVIIWIGGIYTMNKKDTLDNVLDNFNDELIETDDSTMNLTMITDLNGNILKKGKMNKDI